MRIKTVVWFLILIFIVVLGGCFTEKPKNIDNGKGVNVNKNENGISVSLTEESYGVELILEKEIKDEDVIISNDLLKIICRENGRTKLAIASLESRIEAGRTLFSINNCNENIIIRISEKVESIKVSSIKRVAGDVLLGDFDGNGIVNLTDFIEFSVNYGRTYNPKYDIEPAVLGNGAWSGIYSKSTPDGIVGIMDFVTFAQNYGKKLPISPVSIAIIGTATVDKGKSVSLSGEITYNDGTKKQEVLNWTSSDNTIASVIGSTVDNTCILTGISKGMAVLKAEKNALSTSLAITVNDSISGIKLHVKNYTHIYAWQVVSGVAKNLTLAWPGTLMQKDEQNTGWYLYTLDNIDSTNLIFSNNGSGQTKDDSRTKGEWWYDGAWHDTDPEKDVIAPTIEASPLPGNQEATLITVTLTAKDNKDTAPKIYYTIDDTLPVVGQNQYTTGIQISKNTNVKAIAVDISGNKSEVFLFNYNPGVETTPPVVTATPAAGQYDAAQNVTLTIADNKDPAPKLYYTLDGTTPTTASKLYGGEVILVDVSKKISALGVDNLGNSKVYLFDYIIGKVVRTDFREETIYFVLPPRFYDGDPSNNFICWDEQSILKNPSTDPAWRGDFKGLIDKLDYIKALGFSAIWITPPVKNASGIDYHGYHAINFKEIDPRYKTKYDTTAEEAYKKLIDACHAKGLKLIQDIVLNHTGNFGEENLYPMFTRGAPIANEQAEDVMKVVTPNLPSNYFTFTPAVQYTMRKPLLFEDKYDIEKLYHHEYDRNYDTYLAQIGAIADDCVDLNTENPKTAQYLIDAYNKYIDMGVDAFRVDTARHISRLSFNKFYVPAFKQRGGENFFVFGEVCTLVSDIWYRGIAAMSSPFYTWKESKDYPWGTLDLNVASAKQQYDDNATSANQPTSSNHYLTGNDYHKPDWTKRSGMDVIDFTMHHNFNYASDAFRVGKENDKYYSDATFNVVYVDSHDYGPNGAYLKYRFNGTQEDWAENLSLMFTFRGIPCLYYGSEVEFQKGRRIDPGDTLVGPTIPLAQSGRAYFGDYLEGTVTTTDFGAYSATGKVSDTLNYPLAKHIRKLNALRRAVPALQKGQYSVDNISGNLAYKKRFTDDKTDSFVCVTISGNATFSNIPNGKYVDAVTNTVKTVTNNTLTAECAGRGNIRVYVLNGSGMAGGTDNGGYIK